MIEEIEFHPDRTIKRIKFVNGTPVNAEQWFKFVKLWNNGEMQKAYAMISLTAKYE